MTSPDLGTGLPENELIKHHWKDWKNLALIKGVYDEDSKSWDFEFAIDKRGEDESFVTTERVCVSRRSGPLELDIFTKDEPKTIQSAKGEKWVSIEVEPKNPYEARIGVFSVDNTDYYYVEQLAIYLSNFGRAYEQTTWTIISEPGENYSYSPRLKRKPEPQEVAIIFTTEPEPFMVNPEPLQPLKGGNLERLDFLLMKVKKGEILEPKYQLDR